MPRFLFARGWTEGLHGTHLRLPRGGGGKGLYASVSSGYREVIIHGKTLQVPVLRLE
jgi:hypothetical protein